MNRHSSEVLLVLNAGSSSLKFGLFGLSGDEGEPRPIALGTARPRTQDSYAVRVAREDGRQSEDQIWSGSTAEDIVRTLLGWIGQQSEFGEVVAVGHRIVHGGAEFHEPTIIDDTILDRLAALVPLAPLHQSACLGPVQLIHALRPALRQYACFDTAFHRTIEPPAGRYALPRHFEAEGIRHYGFHGLSFESVAAQLRNEGGAAVAKERIIIAHLG
ncbi:MAG TPA: acetate kinase, partial [Sphingomicrobium sp.]|nr:acetate kinase [Sphingomicrobium sp.]